MGNHSSPDGERVRAVGMLSGGLDSTLALALMREQDIDVVGVNFSTGFCLTDHHQKVHREGTDPKKLRNGALKIGADFEVPVEIIDIADEYMNVVKYPRYGYGTHVNPCVDCRILMMTRAREFMEKIGAQFVFTGEVLSQRPKSQHRDALRTISIQSGLSDRLVRPLSARLLAPTWPERAGLLDREKLMGFHGRDRNPQFELARRFGIEEWEQPAGGCCFLTDANYAVKVFDMFEHTDRDTVTRDDMLLCKVGRHFRLDANAKVIVGRFPEEDAFLKNFGGARPRLSAVDHKGSLALLEGEVSPETLSRAARIAARYCAGKRDAEVRVRIDHAGTEQVLEVPPYQPEECEAWILR